MSADFYPFLFDYKTFLTRLTTKPGVYRMIDNAKTVIYVGKAKNLKNRVSSYFRIKNQYAKTLVMIKQVVNIEITVTHTESEALLLENNLIKSLKPRYNILLRDDKSYPYIYLSTSDHFPRLSKHRGARKLPGRYFGPYPSANAVKNSLNLMQKVFPVRQCEDSVFKNRSRPCLQYQIKRCTGPCTGLITQDEYQQDVDSVTLFLEGKSAELIDRLVKRMEQASSALDFERAAVYRDQIVHLRRVQERQYISNEKGNYDVIAIAMQGHIACIQIFFIRDGLNLGNKSYFPKNTRDAEISEVLNAFLIQYYMNSVLLERMFPDTILINCAIADQSVLEQVIREQSGHKVNISLSPRGDKGHWLNMAMQNANLSLQSRQAHKHKTLKQFESLAEELKLEELPGRIECFDISHSSGEATVASCVVFNHEGPLKADYRRFNIESITGGDDYAAMKQALQRRFKHSMSSSDVEKWPLPDILLIDGGKGQVSQAVEVLQEYGLTHVAIIGITKGERRKAHFDTLYIPEFSCGRLRISSGKVILSTDSPGMNLIQQLRDEAHRFAITAHRQRRSKKRQQSELENIPGLGQKRRQLLLKQFGGLQEIKRAGIEDIASVKGIGNELATTIYNYFHE